ncbi:uncharacterized protein [Setaria viridis]|uniref:uncharacterized protein n=1 Tax=Setaria viridis TaxID=4556 RepID=UPI003B3B335C
MACLTALSPLRLPRRLSPRRRPREPNVPLAAALEDEDRHLYKKIRHLSSAKDDSADDDGSLATSSEDHLVGGEKEEGEEVVVEAAVAWTADDEHSIQIIGSLELEKLMSRRSIHRNLIDLGVHIPAVLTKNRLDLHHHHHHHHCDDTGSAPSFLLGQHSNPFDFPKMQMRRHESFTAGAPPRPSRFRPYFVADVPEGGGGDATGRDNSNSSSSTSSSAASDHHLQAQQQAAAVRVEDECSTLDSSFCKQSYKLSLLNAQKTVLYGKTQ